MLSGIHFLLSYACNFECDHCFLYCSPRATGTFSLNQVSRVLDEAVRIGSVEWIYFEGGEPLMFYPLLLESIRKSRGKGFKTGIVSNCYLSTTEDDAAVWLKPLQDAGLDYISVSDDAFHFGERSDTPAKRTLAAAKKLGIDAGSIEIEQPRVEEKSGDSTDKGDPVIGGGALFKGRAVEKADSGASQEAVSRNSPDVPTKSSSGPKGSTSTHTETSICVRESAWAICGERRCPNSSSNTGRTPTRSAGRCPKAARSFLPSDTDCPTRSPTWTNATVAIVFARMR